MILFQRSVIITVNTPYSIRQIMDSDAIIPIPPNDMPIMVEICSGSATVSDEFRQNGYFTISFDINSKLNKFETDHHILGDIRETLPKFLEEQDHLLHLIEFIWFSPPCTRYSCMAFQQGHFKNGYAVTPEGKEADEIVRAGLRFCHVVNPTHWILENPRALLRTRPFMQIEERKTVSYCQYGHPSMKPTDLFGVFPRSWLPKMCKNGAPCHNPAPRGSSTGTQGKGSNFSRSIIPRPLVQSFILAINNDEQKSLYDFPHTAYLNYGWGV